MRYTDAKCKICRREGKKLFLKGDRCYSPKCPIDKREMPTPRFHSFKRRRRISDFGRQLREKQKVKRIYGVAERQFSNYFKLANQKKLSFLQILELRLDNIVYRLGFAPSRSMARQIIFHGHVFVDNKKVNIPSYLLKKGQVVSLNSKIIKVSSIKKMLANKDFRPPVWLKRKAVIGKVERLSERDEIDTEVDEKLIIEYYSR